MSKAKTVLLVRTCLPSLDPTQVSYRWAETVKGHFEANGWQVLDLAENDAVRTRVEELLQGPESCVFIFYGHGLPDRMCGQDRTGVIDLDNVHLLKNQTVYVVACWTAQNLGPAAADIARCYLGYDDEVLVWSEPPYADYQERCVNRGVLEMLDTPSCTIEQARQLIINEYNHWIGYFTDGEGVTSFESFDFAADLRHNRDALAQVFGDEKTTI